LEPRDNTKDSDKSQDKCSSYQFLAYTSPSSSYHSKKNIGESANTFRDRSADNTANNNIEMDKEAPITTTSI
jgi:hypothetical protein